MYGFKSLNPPVSDSGGPLVSDSGGPLVSDSVGPLVSDSGGPLVSTFFVRHFMKGFTGQKKKKRKMDADAATRTASRDAPIFFGNRPPALALRRLFRRYQPPRPPFAVGQLRSVFHYKNSIFM